MLFQKQTLFRCIFVAAISALPSLPVFAVNQLVSDPGDNGGANQLRAKITAAENTGGGTITFTTGPATIVLNSLLPGITTNTTIDGGSVVSVSGNNATQIFYVAAGGTLNLENLTVSHAYNPYADGGAIENDGTLNIYNCKFLSNQTDSGNSGGAIVTYGPLNITNSEFGANSGGNGGALYPRFPAASVNLVGCDFHDNTAINQGTSGWGGAMLLWDGATANLVRDTFENNNTTVNGGTIYVEGTSSLLLISGSQFTGSYSQSTTCYGGTIYSEGAMSISGSSFVNNTGTYGGALYFNSGVVVLSHDLFAQNEATFGGAILSAGSALLSATDCDFAGNGSTNAPACLNGGGISGEAGGLALNRVTFRGNFAQDGGAINSFSGTNTYQNVTFSGNMSYQGGAIYADFGLTSLTNVTIFQNTATNGAGGIEIASPSQTTVLVRNVLLAANAGGNSSGGFGSGTFSYSDDNTCEFGSGHDNVNNILLGPLANNGGAAPTHVPLPGSIAIDNATSLGAPLVDQRGYLRAGAAPDVGAVESSGQPMQITSISRTNTTYVVLKGRGLPNINLNVEISPDPESADFNTLGSTFTDGSGAWQYTDLATSPTNRFYRAAFQY